MAWFRVLEALWLFLPVFAANMSPVFSARLIPKWNAPIDGGRTHRDGRRLLGDGKTWRGLVSGAVVAGAVAVAMAVGAPGPFAHLDFGYRDGSLLPLVFACGALMGAMALVGDTVESYAKRRRGKDRGAPWIPFDQLDFVVFGFLGALLGAPLLAPGWTFGAFLGHWLIPVTLLVLTPALHLLVNRIGYWLRLKDVPW